MKPKTFTEDRIRACGHTGNGRSWGEVWVLWRCTGCGWTSEPGDNETDASDTPSLFADPTEQHTETECARYQRDPRELARARQIRLGWE